ncbi:basic 7S globulin [Pyrus ussuriensis x Pyrus communis]|uniref:Basic 7S globulin n=1 Tax=Pyrus ussuriensis x Pyrus communis TaxID=2448454 RepID=A0A5N5F9D8_9ROSA|nr:basic 7S globulin [Pyrus ussuriensis x Pyrus communis]
MAGLGRAKIGLPSQFASAFSFHRKFAFCLSSSTSSNGVVFYGNGPYVLNHNVVSVSLVYTPLLLNHYSTGPAYMEGQASSDYFINVKSIKINDESVPLNTSLPISTVNPYTVLENTIYTAFVDLFLKEVPAHIPRVAPVEPFGACFNSTHIGRTRVGPAVPTIDSVLQSGSVYWRFLGANSMVQVNEEVLCLGFVDAGLSPSNPMTSIVIGGLQLEENFLQFDLAASRLGFCNSLLSGPTTCADFNFTSIA